MHLVVFVSLETGYPQRAKYTQLRYYSLELKQHATPLAYLSPRGSRRCIDFVFYYPDQNVPMSGACGFDLCNGTMDEREELAADSDFDRTFGIVDTCPNAVGNDEVRVALYLGSYRIK